MWFKKLDFCWTVIGEVGIKSRAWRRGVATSRRVRFWRALLRQGMAAMRRTKRNQSGSATEPIKSWKPWRALPRCIPDGTQASERARQFLLPLFENALHDLVQVLFCKASTYIESFQPKDSFVNLCFGVRSTMDNRTPRGESTEKHSWRGSRHRWKDLREVLRWLVA